jgi:hypothetical protein
MPQPLLIAMSFSSSTATLSWIRTPHLACVQPPCLTRSRAGPRRASSVACRRLTTRAICSWSGRTERVFLSRSAPRTTDTCCEMHVRTDVYLDLTVRLVFGLDFKSRTGTDHCATEYAGSQCGRHTVKPLCRAPSHPQCKWQLLRLSLIDSQGSTMRVFLPYTPSCPSGTNCHRRIHWMASVLELQNNKCPLSCVDDANFPAGFVKVKVPRALLTS